MQQSYAKSPGIVESLSGADLLEDAVGMNIGSMERHHIKLVREYSKVPPILVEKHKVLQILVNVIRNAKYACDNSGREDKQITLRIANGDNTVKISVARQRGWNSRGKHDPDFQPRVHHQKERPRLWPAQRRPGRQRTGRESWWPSAKGRIAAPRSPWSCPSKNQRPRHERQSQQQPPHPCD